MVSINFTPTSSTLGKVHQGLVMLRRFSSPIWLCAAFFFFFALFILGVLLSSAFGCCFPSFVVVGRRTVLPYVSFVFFCSQPGRVGSLGGVVGSCGFFVLFFVFDVLLCILVVLTLQDKVQGRVNDFEDGPWCGLDLVSGWRTFGMVSCCEWVFEVWDAPRDQQPTSHRLHAVHGFRPSLNAILCMSHHTTMNFVQVRNWQGPPRCYTSHPERMSFGTRLASRHFIHFMHSTMRDVVNICPHVKLDNHQVPDVVRFIQCFLNRQVRSLKSTCCQPSLDFGRFDVLWRTNNPAM